MIAKKKEQLFADNLLLSYDYPHSLMMHIVSIKKDIELPIEDLFYDEFFLGEFEKRYASFSNEICEIDLALKNKVVDGFLENDGSEEWEKRVFLTLSLTQLLKKVREYEAVELLESLMYLFQWKMEFEVKRTWEVSDEERAWFHCPVKVGKLYKDSFDLQAKKYIEKQKLVRSQFTQEKIFRPQRPQNNLSIAKDSSETLIYIDSLTDFDTSSAEKKQQKSIQTRNIVDSSENESSGISIYQNSIRIQELSEESYKQEIQQIHIKHENLMSLSLRREIKRARRGNNIAQMHLAEFYAEANTKHTDYVEAIRWYSYASRKGNMRAKYEIGCIFDNEKINGIRLREFGVHCFMELAQEGYPTAQYILGMKYYLGDSLVKDTDQAIVWLKKAALQGIVEAQKQLGNIYFDYDRAEAKKWYYKASASGDLEAMQRLKRF